jgi:transposase-like protein
MSVVIAVRMVLDRAGDYPSQWAAIASVVAKIGRTAQTLSSWFKQAERDSGKGAELSTDDRERLRQLERKSKELRQANGILRKTSACFAQAEHGIPFPIALHRAVTLPMRANAQSEWAPADRRSKT